MGPLHTPPSNSKPPQRTNPTLPQPRHNSNPSSYSDTVLSTSQSNLAPSSSAPRTTAEKWNKLTASIMLFWKKAFCKRSQYSSILKKYANLWKKYLSVLEEDDINHSVIQAEKEVGSIRHAFYKKISREIDFLKNEAAIL